MLEKSSPACSSPRMEWPWNYLTLCMTTTCLELFPSEDPSVPKVADTGNDFILQENAPSPLLGVTSLLQT